jgi:hypothetical protein
MPCPVIGILMVSVSGAQPCNKLKVIPVAVFRFAIIYPLVLIELFDPVLFTIKLYFPPLA